MIWKQKLKGDLTPFSCTLDILLYHTVLTYEYLFTFVDDGFSNALPPSPDEQYKKGLRDEVLKPDLKTPCKFIDEPTNFYYI